MALFSKQLHFNVLLLRVRGTAQNGGFLSSLRSLPIRSFHPCFFRIVALSRSKLSECHTPLCKYLLQEHKSYNQTKNYKFKNKLLLNQLTNFRIPYSNLGPLRSRIQFEPLNPGVLFVIIVIYYYNFCIRLFCLFYWFTSDQHLHQTPLF